MKSLSDLETELKDLQQSHNVDCFTLGIKTYQIDQLQDEVKELKHKIYNKNIDADKRLKELNQLKSELKTETAPEVTQ